MTSSDAEDYPLANGTPSNDTDPIGGAVDTGGGTLTEGSDRIISDVEVQDAGGLDNVYYGAACKQIASAATGTWESPAIYNRAGSKLNSGAGTVEVVSTSLNDTGTVRVTGKVSGVFTQEDVTVTGTTIAAGSETFDSGEVWAWEYLVSGAAAKPIGNILCYVNSELVGVIYGTGLPAATDNGNGNYQANALHEIAVATAKNTVITWSATNNRVTAPDGNVGSYSRCHRFTGDDSSISLASDLVADDYHQYIVKETLPAGLPEPVLGEWVVDVGIIGQAGS